MGCGLGGPLHVCGPAPFLRQPDHWLFDRMAAGCGLSAGFGELVEVIRVPGCAVSAGQSKKSRSRIQPPPRKVRGTCLGEKAGGEVMGAEQRREVSGLCTGGHRAEGT